MRSTRSCCSWSLVHRVRAHRAKIRGIVEAKQRLESEVAMRTHELVESNRQLAEAAQAKSNFLARMSHELRTPMNGVVGMTELLGRTALSSTQTRLTQTIRSSAQILLQIVNDLLDLSKIQAGKVEFESLPLDLAALLEECAALFAGAAEAKGIELIVLSAARQLAALLGDPLRIRQIVLNLIGNAVKFTLQGEVVVKADIDDDEPGRAMLEHRGQRYRRRHGRGDHREDVRAIHPGRRVDHAPLRRHRTGACHMPRARRAHGRHGDRGEPAECGIDVPCAPAAEGARCRGRGGAAPFRGEPCASSRGGPRSPSRWSGTLGARPRGGLRSRATTRNDPRSEARIC